MLNSEVCPVKGDSKENEADIPVVPSKLRSDEIEIQDRTITSPEDATIHKLQENSDDNMAIICASNQKPLVSSSGQYISSNNDNHDLDDDDDGFRTPTSLDHRIPVMKQCPPPPRKRKVSSRKRKLSSPLLRQTTLQLIEASQEIIDSMFPQRENTHHKIKKARS